MMKSEKICRRQLWFILFIMRSVVIVSFLPVLTSANALQDAWITGIVVLFGSEVFVTLITLLDRQFPGLSIIEYSQRLLGKIMGRVVTLLLLGLFLVLSAVEVKLYGELLTTAFLTETPQIVFLFLIILLAVVCVFLGVEVLGRMADIIMGVFIIMFAGIFFISLRYIDLQNLQPIFVRGWSPVLSGSIIPIALVSQSWVIGMLNVTTVNEEKSFWVPITSIGSSLILLIIIAIVVVGVIGPHEGARSVFPIFTLMRSVVLTQFLQRTESLVVFGWGMGLFIYVSTYLYSGASGLARWLNLDDYRPLLPLMGVIWVIVVHYRFKTIFVLQWFLSPEIFGRIGILILIIPLFFLWLALGLKNEQKGG